MRSARFATRHRAQVIRAILFPTDPAGRGKRAHLIALGLGATQREFVAEAALGIRRKSILKMLVAG